MADDLAFFEAKIRPVLEKHCYPCHAHGAKQVEASLYLDSRGGTLAGGDTGPAVVPGQPNKSLLLSALRYEDIEMPPEGQLSEEVIANFAKWIGDGAVDPRTASRDAHEPDITEARQYWAFQPIEDPALPRVQADRWPQRGLDHFILHELERRGLTPAAAASRRQWLRRVSYDLTGLPPTPAEIQAFLTSRSPTAHEGVVDRLLASPRYGERWGQHWLDVVRYAETEGFEYDRLLDGAWRYRDYVIGAFNVDMPYDQFVAEQVAGDELASAEVGERARQLRVAAGFHRLGTVRRNAGNQQVASSRNEVLTERTDILGSVFLGLTVGCARCHDHKFDPISQQDYYRLQAYMAQTQEDNPIVSPAAVQARWKAETDRITTEIDRLKNQVKQQKGAVGERTRARIEQLTASLPEALPVLCSIKNDAGQTTEIHVLRRGSPDLPGVRVGMRPPRVLTEGEVQELPVATEAPRTQLAHWLNDGEHPLAARVIVNRIWQFHFGQGLVRTANDFGRNGAQVSHPHLLDWLASRFLAGDRRLKPLHRRIVLSSTYRQGAEAADLLRAEQVDPGNRLLWRFPRRRLAPEEIRDSMLAVAGELVEAQGGPSVTLPVDEQLVAQLYKREQWIVSPEAEHGRRSVYLLAKRNLRLPFMEVFDQPTAQTSCARREQSTHAPQALELLNGRRSNRLARAFAQRLRNDVGQNLGAQVERAYRLTTARPPTEVEQRLAELFLRSNSLEEFALAIFSLNAFLYVD